MWSNYALSLYRTLTRHKLYAALNVLSLALGIAVCLTLLMVVRFETSFDRWIPEAEKVARVNHWLRFPGRPPSDGPSTQGLLLPALKKDFPQVETGVRILEQDVVVRSEGRQAFERVALADPTLFDVFRLPLAAGDVRGALADTNSIVVSQAMAKKYFGTENALGRTLTLVLDGQTRNYRVTAVARDLPPNTHLKLDLVVRYSEELLPSIREWLNRWGSSLFYTYVRLKAPEDIDTLNAAMPAFVDRQIHAAGEDYSSKEVGFRLLPVTSLHFADNKTGEAFKPGADPLFVGALGVMGVVTLLVAVVNYVSLATARAGMRAREVAVRKVMGATRRALVVQFVAESVVMAMTAGLIAAAVTELALPAVGAMLGEPIRLAYFGADGVLAPLLGLCAAVGLAAGVYPALVLSGFRPAAVLASARTPGGGRTGARVREALTIGQFAIAIALMVGTALIYAQIQYLRNADLGFRRDGLIIVEGIGDPAVAPRMTALLDAFRRTPGVISVTASDRRPDNDSENSGNMRLMSNPKIEPIITRERIGPDYAETYGLKMVAGRALDLQHGLDDRAGLKADEIADRGINIMINETAARSFGFTNPRDAVGERIWMGPTTSQKDFIATVVGVVGDVRFLSPRRPVPPQTYMQNSRLETSDHLESFAAAVRVREADAPAVMKRLEAAWRQVEPGTPFRAKTIQAQLKPFYDADARRGQLFAAGAMLSAIIACLGLYGLAAFNTSRRTKEIGIRKTLGASTGDVLRLLIGDFLRPVLWANLIAWPVAYLAMRSWLAGFDQRIELNPAYFLVPTLAALAVAVVTVADQTWRVARAEPARALRYE